jgi:alpha-D-xyloside xylohydrolase
VAKRLRAEQIPCDVFSIDPTWMRRQYYSDIGVEACNLDWDSGPWGEPEALFKEFAGRGFGVCLWINPYFSEESELYAEAKARGYLAKDSTGGVSRLEFGLAAGILDFTNPDATAWWQGKLMDLLRQGASVFKVDFGDRIPEDAIFFNGKTGKEMHNLYVHLYAGAVFEAVRQVHGTGVVWRRPGYLGSQRYPGSWAGDTQVTWEGMQGALRGGLSAAMTGEAFWSHDMGGFVGEKPSNELYIRWAQFGLLSPLSRFHGTTPREPWHYSDEAVEIVRHYTRLRYTLIPYLLAVAQQAVETGLPILRPMALEFPAEPCVDRLDDQYLLGGELLVAPIFAEGARSRPVYFPMGVWHPLEQPGAPVTGPGFREVAAPLDRIPLFVRAGAVIPRYANAPLHLKGPAPREWHLDLYPGENERRLTLPETGFTCEVAHRVAGGSGQLRISPAPLDVTVRLVGGRPGAARVNREPAAFEAGNGCAWLRTDATDGVDVTYTA